MYGPHFELAFKKGAKQGLGQIAGKGKVEDVFTEGVRRLLQKKAFDHAALAIGTTADVLQRLLQKAIDEGQGVEELGRSIRREFTSMSRTRGLRIARTEMTDTINEGTHAALIEEGARYKEWSTVIDGAERPTHGAANGQIVGIDNVFTVGGASCMYPGEDSLPPEERIGCRCATLAAGLPEDRRNELGQEFLRAQSSLERRFMVDLRRAFLAQGERIASRLPA